MPVVGGRGWVARLVLRAEAALAVCGNKSNERDAFAGGRSVRRDRGALYALADRRPLRGASLFQGKCRYPGSHAMRAGQRSRFMSPGRYGPLETMLMQFNAWLPRAYHRAMPAA